MKKFLVLALALSAAALAAQPSFSAGVGLMAAPGSYDPDWVSKYLELQNAGTVTLINPATPQRQSLTGVQAFAQLSWSGLMARAAFLLAGGSGLSYYYDETGTGRVTVDDRALMVASTLWLGPVLELPGSGSVYFCLGPTYLYGEYRDKTTYADSDSTSWDRQYGGGGFVLPLMLGVETRPMDWLGIAVEGIVLTQQVRLSTTSKPTLGSTSVEQDEILFPTCVPSALSSLLPLPLGFWLQATVSYRF